MFIMYDDVNLSLIPREPHAVLTYINGNFATDAEARRLFPHARFLPMSVTAMVAAPGYDIERGDYRPDQAGELFRLAHDAGIWRPCFYAQLSNMPVVKESLNAVIPNREAVRLLVAAWDGVPIVPPGYDGKQFTNRALGRSLDESILLDTFFPPVKPAPAPDTAWRAVVSVDPDTKSWSIEPAPLGDVKP